MWAVPHFILVADRDKVKDMRNKVLNDVIAIGRSSVSIRGPPTISNLKATNGFHWNKRHNEKRR
jgi:hypothetical protein